MDELQLFPRATEVADPLEYLRSVLKREPDNLDAFAFMSECLVYGRDVFDRKRMLGHATCSAFVLTPDLQEVLLIHHNAYKSWMPPGGHNEEGEPLFECAAREVGEETGVFDIRPVLVDGRPLVLDFDTHEIAHRPSKGEGAHVHNDFLFLAVAPERAELAHQASETGGAMWASLARAEKLFDGTEGAARNERVLRALSNFRKLPAGLLASVCATCDG